MHCAYASELSRIKCVAEYPLLSPFLMQSFPVYTRSLSSMSLFVSTMTGLIFNEFQNLNVRAIRPIKPVQWFIFGVFIHGLGSWKSEDRTKGTAERKGKRQSHD